MILIVEDNTVIADNIAEYLDFQGIETKTFYDGESAFEYIIETQEKQYGLPQGIILDRMMPKLDGLSLARMLKNRGFHIPIIFLTALDKPVDRLEGLEVGAIDYLSKPVELRELSLKIKNLLELSFVQKKKTGLVGKQNTPNNPHEVKTNIIDDNSQEDGKIQIDVNISLDRKAKLVTVNSAPIALSPKEFGILELLAIRQGSVVTYDTILETVWHESSEKMDIFQSSITVHIAYLRKKLGTSLIRTIKLTGYILDRPK